MLSANKLDFFLGDGSRLITEARQSISIDAKLAAALPAGLRHHCVAGRLASGVLRIHADNGSTALKLRQITPTLTERLKAGGIAVESLKISVRVDVAGTGKKPVKPGMGRKGIDAFRVLADTLDDSPLRASIEHLLSRLGHE